MGITNIHDALEGDEPSGWEMPEYEFSNLPEPKPAFYTVAIFMVDRAYGGPEEGGWWFDYGEPIDHIPEGINPHDLITVFDGASEDEAGKWCATLQDKLDATCNVGRREVSSMASEGRYAAILCEGWPEAFPKERPHYE